MHWKVKIFTLLYQHAAIPTPLGPWHTRFSSEIPEPGLKICSVFTVASLPAALIPFCALAFECWLCAESSVSNFFSVSRRIAGLVSGAPGAVSAISWLAVPAAELPKTQPRCSQNQPAGRALAAGSAACQGARLRSWDAEEEEKQPLPQNMIQITPCITWPLSRAWGSFSQCLWSPMPSLVEMHDVAGLCRSQETPLKIPPLCKKLGC